MTQVSALDIVRPFLWIGASAFVIGFAGYLLLGSASEARYAEGAPAAVQASAPASPPPVDWRAV